MPDQFSPEAARTVVGSDPRVPVMDTIVIAIHGIGSQRRSDTVRSVARRFGARSDPPLPVMPLGFFNLGKSGEVQLSRLDTSPNDELAHIGFAEVYWADIPRAVVKEDDTLEDTKAWGTSVVSRAHATYLRNVVERQLTPGDFQLGAGVVEEIIETVSVMENLLAFAQKAGIFKFELAPLLRDYVGDVQLVTEFKFYRDKIVYRFHSAMCQIIRSFGALHPGATPKIHVVAHSEGTVVSFLGLLQALSNTPVRDPENPSAVLDTGWIQYVRGFMTIGSPIDKHILLWPKLWEGMSFDARGDGTAPACPAGAIKWRNYYDYGDPIGFKLETAVEFLRLNNCTAFEFVTADHDIGFSRYWLPGKAHNDYWQDQQVFEHFIDDVVLPGTRTPTRPRHSPTTGIVSTAIPYALSMVLHFVAVYVMFKGVTSWEGVGVSKLDVMKYVGQQIGLLSWLLICTTVAARVPQLVKTTGWRWHVASAAVFAIGALPCVVFLLPDAAELRSWLFSGDTAAARMHDHRGGGLFAAVSAVAVLSGWLASRTPRTGRRRLIWVGGSIVAVLVAGRIFDDVANAPVWPLVLAGAAFVYTWWLGILLFDLAFIWHRYVRQSVAVDTLAAWGHGHDAHPKVLGKPAGRKPKPVPAA